MKTIGLIGGMSWKSSLEYYRIMNESVKEKMGGLHSAKCILYSVEFEEIVKLQHQGKWEELTKLMIDAAQRLEKAGVDFIVICANTMYKMADDIQNNVSVPLIHIADAIADEIMKTGLRKVALLGTKFTMEEDFYKKRLREKHGIGIIIPNENDRKTIHKVIFDELCLGIIKQSSKEIFKKIINNLITNGAEGIILGCTEIPFLIKQEDVEVPIFDTTTIHAKAAVNFALKES